MKTCENCGCAIYSLGCVNCDEQNYIDEQIDSSTPPEVQEMKEAK